MSDEQDLSAYLDGLGVPTVEEHEQQTQTGRSPSGRLRNFGAMNDGKLFGVLQQVERENNDPEALSALRAEAARR